MIRFIIFCLLIILCTSHVIERVFTADPEIQQQRFNEFKKTFGKVYETESENSMRFAVFLDSLKIIDEMNELYNKTIFKITQFSATLQTEMEDLNQMQSQSFVDMQQSREVHSDFTFIPNNFDAETECNSAISSKETSAAVVDYRESGLLTSIADQAGCGSCFAFAACAVMEYQWKKMGEEISHFSAQYFVNCCETKNCNGCKGGQPADVFRYSQEHGMPSTALFGYTGTEGICYPSNNFAAAKDITIIERTAKQSSQVRKIVNYLTTVGPMATGMYGSGKPFKLFAGGEDDIVDDRICEYDNTKKIDHAIAVVGYRIVNGRDVWIVRNSWGTRWGNKGYFSVYVDACGFDLNEFSGSLVERRSSSFYIYFGIIVGSIGIVFVVFISIFVLCKCRNRNRNRMSNSDQNSNIFEYDTNPNSEENETDKETIALVRRIEEPHSPRPAYSPSPSLSISENKDILLSERPTLTVAQVTLEY